MSKDKGNRVFREVMKGTRERTPTAAERAKDAQREAEYKRESDRIKAESAAINAELDRQRRSDLAHARAEEERRALRNQGK